MQLKNIIKILLGTNPSSIIRLFRFGPSDALPKIAECYRVVDPFGVVGSVRGGKWPSETSKCRDTFVKYCKGNGIDIGPGGDPIVPAAVRVDLPRPYSLVGDMPVQLAGDSRDLYWFRDEVLDYVYSSHVLEDFADTEQVLREWLRVLKKGGHLCIFCPDEKIYREHCRTTKQPYNPNHVHACFSLDFVRVILDRIGGIDIIHEKPLAHVYSWEIVVMKY
jgi:SAM-dependent methyltransferase